MVKISQLSDSNFSKIEALVCGIMQKDVNTSKETVQAIAPMLREGRSVNFKAYPDDMIALERALLDCVKEVSDIGEYSAIEFPVNVRAAHSTPPEGYLEKRDPTDFMHCDPWAGEPNDTVNFFLYMYVEPGCSTFQLFDSIRGVGGLDDFFGGYGEVDLDESTLEEIPVPVKAGTFVMFDSLCPHRTVRGTGGVRISIDFRMRPKSPYEDVDDRWMRDRIPLGKYWSLPSESCASFAQRREEEFAKIGDVYGPNSAQRQAREAYLDKFHP